MHLNLSCPAVSHLEQRGGTVTADTGGDGVSRDSGSYKYIWLHFLAQIYLYEPESLDTSICLQYGVAYQSVCEVDSDHRRSSYSHLQTEGNAQHLKALHLKVHSDRGFVVLLKRLLAEP